MDQISQHINNLKQTCRMCGKRLDKQVYNKKLFKQELLELYDVDVENDLTEIHPPFICKTDARILYRFRDSAPNAEANVHIVPKRFFPHTDECLICQVKVTGRPRNKDTNSSGHSMVDGAYNQTVNTKSISVDSNQTNGESFASSSMNSHTTFLRNMLKEMSLEEKEHFFEEFISGLLPDDMHLINYVIGKHLNNSMKSDIELISLFYRDVESVADIDIFKWVEARESSVLSYLLGIAGYNSDLASIKTEKEKLLSLAVALEQLYKLASPTLILPLAFLLNVCNYATTGSKTVVDMLGASSPAGHYKAVTQWLRELGSVQSLCPEGDLMNVFDNEQVIAKSYIVKPNNKVKVSVITNKGVVQLMSPNSTDVPSMLQSKIDLKPPHSLKVDKILSSVPEPSEQLKHAINEILEQSSNKYVEWEKEHYNQLYCFVQEAIDAVFVDQKKDGDNFTDSIDNKISADTFDATSVKCLSCGTINRKRKQICEGCKDRDGIKMFKQLKKDTASAETAKTIPSSPSYHRLCFESNDSFTEVSEGTLTEERYFNVKSNHKGKHELTLTDPVFCNPNSFTTVARVLRKIGVDNGIARYGGTKRHWTFVCCDGLPFLICKKLKEEAVICTVPDCNQRFLRMSEFLRHGKDCHPDLSDCPFIYEFDWFYLRIGSGHYEMNLLKSFIELNWIPYFETLAEKMGFVSPTAKQYAKACKDHHKSWSLLLIFHHGSLMELVTPYVRYCLQTGKIPEAKEFFKYISDEYESCRNPNLRYLMDQVCRISQGIINFRMAIRRNYATLLKSAKHMTKELFHGRSHPNYQSIEIFDSIQDIMMPEEVRTLNDEYASITTTGNKSTGEDFDFVLEEKNKQLKAWIPKGLPSDKIWQTVCRNNRTLEKIKHNTLSLFGVKTDTDYVREIDIDTAVELFRSVLRKCHYFSQGADHTSLDGKALDENLVNFLEDSTKRRTYFIRCDILGEERADDSFYRHPIPITPEERRDMSTIRKMTIPEITKEIHHLMELIPDEIQKQYHCNLFQTEVMGKKKEKYFSFLQELKEAIVSSSAN